MMMVSRYVPGPMMVSNLKKIFLGCCIMLVSYCITQRATREKPSIPVDYPNPARYHHGVPRFDESDESDEMQGGAPQVM